MDKLLGAHWPEAVLIVPTRLYARFRTERLLVGRGLAGIWGRKVFTFENFATWLLHGEGIGGEPIDELERRRTMAHALHEVGGGGALDFLGAGASTEGFAAHLLRVIDGLKQAAVRPEEFSARVALRRHGSELDGVVGAVYQAYQKTLIERGLFDRIGAYWLACDVCAAGRPSALAGACRIFFDGFDDFTPSEFRLIEHLMPHVDEIVVGLNYDTSPGRQDLHVLSRSTADLIRERFGSAREDFSEPPPASYTEYAAGNFLGRDAAVRPSALRADLAFVPCLNLLHEVETIGRRIKLLLADGGAAGSDVCVVCRDLGSYASTLQTVFNEYGIPFESMNAPRLTESLVCGFLLLVFDALDTWQRDTVLDVLVSPWFAPDGDAGRAYVGSFRRLAWAAGIVSGRDEWVAGCGRLRDRLVNPKTRPAVGGFALGEDCARGLDSFLARVSALISLDDALPRKGSVGSFSGAAAELVGRIGLEAAVAGHALEDVRLSEGSALAALRVLLWRLQGWGGGWSGNVERTAFASRFRQMLGAMTFRRPGTRGGVMCLDAAAARHLRFDYVFFCGANEGELPRPAPINAIYSDEDAASLKKVGIRVDDRSVHSQREALLFHHALHTARKQLCITWRRLGADGEPLNPSPYVSALLELLPGDAMSEAGIRPDGFVPAVNEACSLREFRNAVSYWHRGACGFCDDALSNMRYGVGVESDRRRRGSESEYGGAIRDADLVADLGLRFGDGHVFSASQLEAYAACPFSFFAAFVLGLDSVEAPSYALAPRMRGALMHRILHCFHSEYGGTCETLSDGAEALRACIDRVFADWRSWAPPGVLELERRHMAARLERYIRVESSRGDGAWRPTYFELAFGEGSLDTPVGLGFRAPLKLDTPEGEVCLSGRIDRVDARGDEVRVIDYKSGAAPKSKDIVSGLSLQLQIYAFAVETLLSEVRCAEAYFLEVGRKRRVEGLGRGAGLWPERAALARERIGAYVGGIRGGRFAAAPAVDGACTYCEGKCACRFARGRLEREPG